MIDLGDRIGLTEAVNPGDWIELDWMKLSRSDRPTLVIGLDCLRQSTQVRCRKRALTANSLSRS